MSKSKTHDSWRAWGEYRKERSRLKDFDNWKNEALEELNMASVFIVMNEWDFEDGGGSEIVGGVHYTSESQAWDALSVIAERLHMELDPSDTSLLVRDGAVDYESYYIEELLNGDVN